MATKFLFVILMALVAGVGAVESLSAQEASREASNRNEDVVLEYLRPVISSSGKAVRIYYRAMCHRTSNSTAEAPVPFPLVNVQPPPKDKTGLAAVREIFKNDQNVTVAEEPEGIIRVWIGKVPTAILETKLSVLALDRLEQYNQRMAINAIKDTKKMQAAMRSLAVLPVSDLGGLVAEASQALPHLPATMQDVTVDQALDVIAKTFHHVVVYGACAEPTGPDGEKLFWIE